MSELFIVDLDSPFLFGVARRMTADERKAALAHGVTEDRPMSVLGITSEGLAGVDGKELALKFAAVEDLLETLINLLPIIDDAESDAVAKSIAAQEAGKEVFRLKWLDIASRFKAQADNVRAVIAKATGKEGA